MAKHIAPVDLSHQELSDDVSYSMIAEPKGSRPRGGLKLDVSQLWLETGRSRPTFDAESESVLRLWLRCLVPEIQLP